ncbi:hypothetical protein [Sphingosinicella xenopeptidilytica]|uniref:Uncharacterized protein n=1 Tax=Sphingosinicella xenopeptidilytica TaxID=364098 RepID=A0ABW3C0Z0_SPHXN
MQAERHGRNQGTPAGLLIALGLFAGTGFGIVRHQAMLGAVIGMAAGIALAVLWTLFQRRR